MPTRIDINGDMSELLTPIRRTGNGGHIVVHGGKNIPIPSHSPLIVDVPNPPSPKPEPAPPPALTADEQTYLDLCKGTGLPKAATGPELQVALESGDLSKVPPAVTLALKLLASNIGAMQDQMGLAVSETINAKVSALEHV